jgi:hypothetical protein
MWGVDGMKRLVCLLALAFLFALPVAVIAADRTVCDSECDFTLIQSCAAVAVAGDTCLVYGDYSANELVSTVNAGTSDENRIIYKAMGEVRIKHFRILDPYITVDGFTITGYIPYVDTPGASRDAAIRIEVAANYYIVRNNRIIDGIYLYDPSFTWNAAAKTVTASAGDFVAAGFVPGMRTYNTLDVNLIASGDHPNHDNVSSAPGVTPATFQTMIVKTVTPSTLTYCAGEAGFPCSGATTVITDDTDHESYIYPNLGGFDKNGPWAIFSIFASGVGASNGIIEGNTFSNLAGRNVQIAGNNNVIRNNTFVNGNGWRYITVIGNNHRIQYNVMKDSPRWTGFPQPSATFAEAGQGTFDMYDNIFVADGTTVGTTTNNLLFDHNIIVNVDHQIFRINGNAAGNPGSQSQGHTITNNVFHSVDKSGRGQSQAPGVSFRNNIVVNSTHETTDNSAHSLAFAESGNGDAGDPPGTDIMSNAWVGNGCYSCDNMATTGWYTTISGFTSLPTPGVEADYNFVAGPEAHGYPAKTAIALGTLEANGINGGDPLFQDINNPLGDDGLPWTADDGLMPKANSPLCGEGEGGVDIGPYACIAAESATLKRVCAAGAPYCTYTTIQACADAVGTGVTCLVDMGTYAERVVVDTTAGQTFRAHGKVTMKGFSISVANTTIDGFDMTAPGTGNFTYVIDLLSGGSSPGAHFTTIINNTIRDTCGDTTYPIECTGNAIGGINSLYSSSGDLPKAHDIVIRNNTLENLSYSFFNIVGNNWLIEGNKLKRHNMRDFFIIAGDNLTIRRNVIGPAQKSEHTSNHPDIMQMFDTADGVNSAINTIFEENFVYALDTAEFQHLQMNASKGGTNGIVDDFHHVTIRRNVFANVLHGNNSSVPYVTWENNTFYRTNVTADGINIGGTMSRGTANNATVRNNVLLGMGVKANLTASQSNAGFYGPVGQVYSIESVNLLVTLEVTNVACSSIAGGCPDAVALYADMIAKGYLITTGAPTAAFRALTSVDDYQIDASLIEYKQAAFDGLTALVAKVDLFEETWVSEHNFVAGAPSSGYLGKRTNDCNCAKSFTQQNFCEAEAQCNLGGINGGDPDLQNKHLLSLGALSIPYISGGTFDATTKTLTKTGAFANYTPIEGDHVFVYSGSQFLSGKYSVAAKVSSDCLSLGAILDGSGTGLDLTHTGTAVSGTTADIVLDAGASALNDAYNNQIIAISSGTGSGQVRTIFDYVGSTKTVVVSAAFSPAPDNTSVFRIIPTNIVAVAVTPPEYVLGPDGIPFTLDDGLKPRRDSFLCNNDSNGKDIGAYSCDPRKVLETSIAPPTEPGVQ